MTNNINDQSGMEAEFRLEARIEAHDVVYYLGTRFGGLDGSKETEVSLLDHRCIIQTLSCENIGFGFFTSLIL